jgi:hypothetical protein
MYFFMQYDEGTTLDDTSFKNSVFRLCDYALLRLHYACDTQPLMRLYDCARSILVEEHTVRI